MSPDKVPDRRYHSDNPSYGPTDAAILHGMLRIVQPRRVIEIGSGFSSAMTLDTVERDLAGQTEVTFIEPYPELLESLLTPQDHDRVTIMPTELQAVGLELFQTLEAGDLQFIDSTHVLRTGSDVVYLYTEVLPRVAEGVHIHIHDMFRGFEYPQEWVMEGRAWGEGYLVNAFLAFNRDFEITLFSNWLTWFHREHALERLPAVASHTPGSLWLRRVSRSA